MDLQVDPRLRSNAPLTAGLVHNGALQSPYAANPNRPRLPPPPNLSPLSSEGPPQRYYRLPSVGAQSPSSDTNAGTSGGNDPKRPRACESCRGLKVRCDIDVNNPEGSCKRCAKAGRQCVVTAPSRKRQKKTDSRVAELEKKIDALTASLIATKSGAQRHDGESGDESLVEPVRRSSGSLEEVHQVLRGHTSTQIPVSRVPHAGIETNEWLRGPPERFQGPPSQDTSSLRSKTLGAPSVGQKRTHSGEMHINPTNAASPESRTSAGASSAERQAATKEDGPNLYPFLIPKGSKMRTLNSIPTPESTASSYNNYEYGDVIDRRILSSEMAAGIFDYYLSEMAPHSPFVVFPPGTTVAEIRRTKPTLFLAILAVASGICHPEIQRTLTKEIMRGYADRIIFSGEKSLELIQSLLVSTLWYWPPEHYEELKFYQLIHIAAVMAIDIGIGRRLRHTKPRRMVAGMWRDHPHRKAPYPSPETPEARRAWLGCYFTACNAAQSLRRPNLIRWTSYMQDCVEFFESSSEALPTDKILCHIVRCQHIAEEVAVQFAMDDSFAPVSISDPKVQYALKGFERQFEEWKTQIPRDIESPALKLSKHVVNLYIHEVAMHIDHNVDDFRPPFIESTFPKESAKSETGLLTSAHIDALSACLTSAHGVFDSFLTFGVGIVRALPIYNFVRMAYAVVALIKLYFAASAPNSELGKVFKKEDMKVEFYLDALLDVFRATAEEDKYKPASKFCMVLLMLKTWFQKIRDGKGGTSCGTSFFGKEACAGAKFAKHFGGEFVLGHGQCPRARAAEVGESRSESAMPTPRPSSAYPQILGNGESTPVPAKDSELNQQRQQQHGPAENGQGGHSSYSTANTPLQLLSEVAMGNSNGVGESPLPGRGSFSSYPWMNVNMEGGPATPSTTAGTAEGGTSSEQQQNFGQKLPATNAPAAAGEPGALDAMMGGDQFAGFDQMGFSDGDFASFMDDGFFNTILDGAPNIFDTWG